MSNKRHSQTLSSGATDEVQPETYICNELSASPNHGLADSQLQKVVFLAPTASGDQEEPGGSVRYASC